MKLWTMREIMTETGTTESALRYYNEKKVVTPTIKESSGRRRWLYSEDDLQKIELIQMMKFIGVSVGDMKDALDGEEHFGAVMRKSIAMLEAEKKRIQDRVQVAQRLAQLGIEGSIDAWDDFNNNKE